MPWFTHQIGPRVGLLRKIILGGRLLVSILLEGSTKNGWFRPFSGKFPGILKLVGKLNEHWTDLGRWLIILWFRAYIKLQNMIGGIYRGMVGYWGEYSTLEWLAVGLNIVAWVTFKNWATFCLSACSIYFSLNLPVSCQFREILSLFMVKSILFISFQR